MVAAGDCGDTKRPRWVGTKLPGRIAKVATGTGQACMLVTRDGLAATTCIPRQNQIPLAQRYRSQSSKPVKYLLVSRSWLRLVIRQLVRRVDASVILRPSRIVTIPSL